MNRLLTLLFVFLACTAPGAQQTINTGTVANDGTGDTLRTAGGKINANFTELYSRTINGQALTGDVTITTITGNAGTATTLATPRTINGVSFNGSANITVTAAAATLTGTTLASNVVTSSLTSVGTLVSPSLNQPLILDALGNTVLQFQTAVTGAVNYLEIQGNQTGAAPQITALGTDNNVGINLLPKGSGTVTIDGVRVLTTADTGVTAQAFDSDLAIYATITPSANVQTLLGAANYAAFKSSLSLGNVDNTSDATKNAAAATLTNKKLTVTAAHASDDTCEGTQIAGLNAGATIAQWEAVYLGASSTWLLADANGSGTYPARGLAVAAYSNTNAATILVHGTVRNDAWNWTPGGTIYLSATAGGLTQSAPATSGDKVQQVGFALTADIAFFDFASGETVTVQ